MDTPLLIHDSPRSFAEACAALELAVPAHGFGILGSHDLGSTLRAKGLAFAEDCRVYELCQPQQAARVLSGQMALSAVLPCRISVYTEAGSTRLAMVRPASLLGLLSGTPGLDEVAAQVERDTVAILEAASA